MKVRNKKPAIICDIDNTILDMTHRYPLLKGANTDWEKFCDRELILKDKPIWDVIDLINVLGGRLPIIFITGRNEGIREVTIEQLDTYIHAPCGKELYMRKDDDRGRPDIEVKKELYDKYVAPYYNIVGAFDDKSSVIQLWRSLGITAYHTGELATGDGF